VSDDLYGRQTGELEFGLRAVRLAYADPFIRKPVEIIAPTKYFLKDYGFAFQPEHVRYEAVKKVKTTPERNPEIDDEAGTD
jgi:hypothetical protein